MTNDIHRLKSDNDECRVLAFSNAQLPDYRRAMEEAITALLSAPAPIEPGTPAE
jgi:hypothetical protein